jgi:hypothetical protein
MNFFRVKEFRHDSVPASIMIVVADFFSPHPPLLSLLRERLTVGLLLPKKKWWRAEHLDSWELVVQTDTDKK